MTSVFLLRVAILLTMLVSSAFVFASDQQQKSSLIPVEAFSRLPMHQYAKLSPDGTQVAFIYNFQSPEKSVLTVINIDSGAVSYLMETDNIGQRIRWFNWANNKTLVGGVAFAGSRGSTNTTETRLISVDVQDPQVRYLVKPRMNIYNREFISQFQDRVLDMLPDEPEHVLVALDIDEPFEPSVFKLNIYTNRKSRILRNRYNIRRWMTDRSGDVRLAISLDYEQGNRRIEWLNDEDDWVLLFDYDALEETGIEPIGFGADNRILYYRAYQGDRKKLFKINAETKEITEIFSDSDYDFEGRLIFSKKQNKVIGIMHADERRGPIYWDPERQSLEQKIKAALPGTDNALISVSADENRYIVYAHNDVSPGKYYIGDRKLKRLHLLLQAYPGLTPELFNPHKLVTYKARDDVEIEGLLTLPKTGQAPFPTIIHPHGGPGSRDIGGFDIWTAYFNSRGYAVFRPNFRGSDGYGLAFASERYEGWGLAMQDDITDGTRWLIKEEITDPERICIIGASYGGYAALMGAVKTPDLFQCAVSFGGVMDLPLVLRQSANFANNEFVKKQLGTDSDDLKARSPAYNAHKINIPVLLVHGEDDRIAHVDNSRNMRDALESNDKEVQYLELEKGNHFLSIQANRHAFFRAMEGFLEQHMQTKDNLASVD